MSRTPRHGSNVRSNAIRSGRLVRARRPAHRTQETTVAHLHRRDGARGQPSYGLLVGEVARIDA
ncbi:hypothetical protein OH687_22665 [Burkholderia anthina]|nr:hypothetical protein OH687_22665 [Burkholderia anthina]